MTAFNNPLPSRGARALLLGRFSDAHQNPLSADDQLAVLRQDCERHGWEVVGEFKDEAKSGRVVAGRTGYLDMMAMAEAGLADVICVFHLDRLGRNARELHDANNRLRDVDAVIFTHDKGVMSRIEFALYAEMAQMESERIAERTGRGRRAAAERGRFMGSIPYGYRAVPETDGNGEQIVNRRGQIQRKPEIDPEAAKLVLRVHQDFDAGMSPHQIAIALNSEGVPTPFGGRLWHPNTIMGVSRSMSGLLRNPLYAGRYVHGKVVTDLDSRTGKVRRRRSDVANRIEHEMPWLRIVPQDLWERNQERLSNRPPSKLVDRRRPTYLFTGLVKCGVCGGSFVQVSTKMGCTAHQLKACSNRRQLRREQLEEAVLDGLVDRLARPNVVQWFIPEYERERRVALVETDDRYGRAVSRLSQVDREIENLIKQVKSGASGYAAKLLNENLESLGAEKDRLSREVRAGPPTSAKIESPDDLTWRLQDLLANLREALNGDERDAARARDIVRGLITRIIVTPMEEPGKRPDGRGAGAMRVTVEGQVSQLVDSALLDRKIMHSRGASDVHDLPIATFRFYVDLDPPQSVDQQGVWRDATIIARMLDDADCPVLFQDMVDAFNDRGRGASATERDVDESRARIALAQFRRGRWARSVRLGKTHGWVWNVRDISDDEWWARYEARGKTKPPVGVVRLEPPQAYVVVIGAEA